MSIFRTIIPVAFISALVISVESCSKKAGDENTIEFETRIDSVGYVVPDFYGDTVYSASKYSVVWPEKIGQEDFETFRDSLLNLTFGDSAASTFEQATERFLNAALNNLRMEGDTTEFIYSKVPYEEAYDASRANISQINSIVTLLNPQLLVVQVNTYGYVYGSAHGSQSERFLNYSIADKKLLSPENTFQPGNEKAILDLINTAAREKYTGEAVLFDTPIASFDNFQMTEDAIIFVYQPYDVGPYSSGIIRVPVSNYDLYRFLTPLARKALSLS